MINSSEAIRAAERHSMLRDQHVVAKAGMDALHYAQLHEAVEADYVRNLSEDAMERYCEQLEEFYSDGRTDPVLDLVQQYGTEFDEKVRTLAGVVGGYTLTYIGIEYEQPGLVLHSGEVKDETSLIFDVENQAGILKKLRYVNTGLDSAVDDNGHQLEQMKLEFPVDMSDVSSFNGVVARLNRIYDEIIWS